ncbi:MAG TPA: hypothetical protein VKO87_01975, partial [Gemmatimonadaceae bacterium]|nr:hypothetical protein [Gemmatimonadaceae bacterium]
MAETLQKLSPGFEELIRRWVIWGLQPHLEKELRSAVEDELRRAQHPAAPRGFVHDGGCSRSCEPAQPASPSKNIVRGLEGMRDLKDGWDTYDGKKPTEAAIAAVESMQAVPVSSGGIQLDWGEFQSVEIGPDGKVVEEQEQSAAPSEAQPDQNRGIYMKYLIERTDGSSAPGGKHERCEYFVLDWEHDKFAVPAARAYADACAREFPELARDLRAMANEHARHIDSAEAQPAAPSEASPAGVPCSICGKLRTESEGANVFTTCEGPGYNCDGTPIAQPAAPSPDVERAVHWLRAGGFAPPKMAAIIAAALDRLRSENNQLRLNVAAVTEDFQQLTRECDILRDERDRLKLYEPRCYAAL